VNSLVLGRRAAREAAAKRDSQCPGRLPTFLVARHTFRREKTLKETVTAWRGSSLHMGRRPMLKAPQWMPEYAHSMALPARWRMISSDSPCRWCPRQTIVMKNKKISRSRRSRDPGHGADKFNYDERSAISTTTTGRRGTQRGFTVPFNMLRPAVSAQK